MCKSKAENGGVTKRCFAHHHLTKASLLYIEAVTGVDKQQIYAIMKELRKEGRMLDAPTKEELDAYFNLEEFKTKYNNSLTEKEKVTILKNLLDAKAEQEEQPVTGGTFHALKNSLARTVERFKRPFAALAITGTLLASLSGCVGVGVTPTPDNTSSPVASECVVENPTALGDAIPNKIIKDEYGSYCSLTVNPADSAKYVKLDSDIVDQSVRDTGITQAQLDQYQGLAYKQVVEQTLDSTRLDNYKVDEATWIKNSNMVSPTQVQDFLTNVKNGKSNGLIITNLFTAPLNRSDTAPAPRSGAFKISTAKINVVDYQSEKYIVVTTNYSTVYTLKDTDAIALIQKFQPNKTVEQIKSENKSIGDIDPNTTMIINGHQQLTYKVGDTSGLLYGSGIGYSLYSPTGDVITGN